MLFAPLTVWVRAARFVVAVLSLATFAPCGIADRWVRVEHNGAPHYGRIEGDRVLLVDGAPWDDPRETGESIARESAKTLVPTTPRVVLGAAFNFRSHLGERKAPTKPEFFWKAPDSLVANGEAIALPDDARDAHYEAELVVVIGRETHNATLAEAGDAIFGYTCGNDVTERAWATSDVQWWRAKATRTFGPVGPEIVTGLDWRQLRITGKHNGKLVQDESAADMLFGPAELVAFASRYVTLRPGDLVFTASPGITSALRPGDVYEVRISGIAKLSNPVRRAD